MHTNRLTHLQGHRALNTAPAKIPKSNHESLPQLKIVHAERKNAHAMVAQGPLGLTARTMGNNNAYNAKLVTGSRTTSVLHGLFAKSASTRAELQLQPEIDCAQKRYASASTVHQLLDLVVHTMVIRNANHAQATTFSAGMTTHASHGHSPVQVVSIKLRPQATHRIASAQPTSARALMA